MNIKDIIALRASVLEKELYLPYPTRIRKRCTALAAEVSKATLEEAAEHWNHEGCNNFQTNSFTVKDELLRMAKEVTV